MEVSADLRVPCTCECGTEYEVPITGKDLEAMEFTCPGCGKFDAFTKEQIEEIVRQYDAIAKAVREHIQADMDGALARVSKRSKHIKYRKK